MATEYFQPPSSQGLLSLEASSTLSSSSVLSASGTFPSSVSALSANNANPASDPWLTNTSAQMKKMSLGDWASSTNSLKKSHPPSLFEPDDIESRSWENIIPQQTPEVLKASFELKNSFEFRNPHQHKAPQHRFLSASSKIESWSHLDPSVSISSPGMKSMSLGNSLNLGNSTSSLKRSTASIQDDDETSLIRYKTELCKSFTETGICRYGVKCQFAHGKEELRSVLRHPKYKTEICKTFHNTGTCPYGIRCRFIHTRTKEEHQVFSSSASSFVDSDFEPEGSDDEAHNKVAPPPGIPVPHWSKSWTPTASPVMRGSNSRVLPPKKMQA